MAIQTSSKLVLPASTHAPTHSHPPHRPGQRRPHPRRRVQQPLRPLPGDLWRRAGVGAQPVPAAGGGRGGAAVPGRGAGGEGSGGRSGEGERGGGSIRRRKRGCVRWPQSAQFVSSTRSTATTILTKTAPATTTALATMPSGQPPQPHPRPRPHRPTRPRPSSCAMSSTRSSGRAVPSSCAWYVRADRSGWAWLMWVHGARVLVWCGWPVVAHPAVPPVTSRRFLFTAMYTLPNPNLNQPQLHDLSTPTPPRRRHFILAI